MICVGLRICSKKSTSSTRLEAWLKINTDYASQWPNITAKREAPADAKEFDGVEGKLEKYFSPNPGQGD